MPPHERLPIVRRRDVVAFLVLAASAAGLSRLETLPPVAALVVLGGGSVIILAAILLRQVSGDRDGSRFAAGAALVVAIPAVGMGGWAGGLQLLGNFHVVEPGALYRSAQMDPAALDTAIRRYGIRTVINLRGAHEGEGWYDAERAVTATDGVGHVDIALSARAEPDPETIARLVAALRDSPRPILVHCQSGSDRTGLAAALYELEVMGRPPGQAAAQLSFYYGHFPWLGSKTVAMDRSFQRIAAEAEGRAS